MKERGWTEMAERWQAADDGGWLVIGHWRHEHRAVAWHEVDEVDWVPQWGRWAQPTVLINHGGRQDAYPCHELAAQRLRRWWRLAREQRLMVPRWREVSQLLADPAQHGGHRWMSRLVLAVSPKEAVVLSASAGGRDPLHQLSFELVGQADDLTIATHLIAPAVDWSLVEGVATYVFDWCRPTFGRRHGPLTGVLAIDHFRTEADAPMVPSGPHAHIV